MSQNAEHHAPPMSYIIIWVVLVVLFAASIAFSLFSSLVVGVVFAFFIAIVKALMVAAWFMHLNIEPRWVWVLLAMALGAVFVMWLGMAPDIMEPAGANWSKLQSLPGYK